MSLLANPVSELTLLTAPPAILDEWLAQWFDGDAHVVGVNPAVTFPRAHLAYGQGPVGSQPLQDRTQSPEVAAEIRVIAVPMRSVLYELDDQQGDGREMVEKTRFHFWVRAKKAGPGQSQYLANRTAELLHAVLNNPSTRYELALKGIAHLKPRAPDWMPGDDYAERLIACTADIHYRVLFETAVPLSAATSASVDFFRVLTAIVGEYLEGYYRWTSAVTLASARAVSWASEVSPTVIELEINGVLSGHQITIPVGAPNEELLLPAVTLNVALPAGEAIRWKVVSAPAPESAAWRLSVNVTLAPEG